ncbi:MAG: hypothetical protein QXH00_06460 [Candidatus Jordarchaeales archaeon]
MWKKRLTFIVAVSLLFASLLASSVASPAWVEVSGDSGKVNVIINYWPGTDKFGKPSVNPDGSFYPNDRLWVKYDVYVAEGLSFSGVQTLYDQSAFEKLQDIGWGSTSGTALFKVKADASPGLYDFRVKAEASTTVETGVSGSVDVTFEGVDVYAYYRAECLLTILAAEHGTTNPAPGSYWCVKDTSVSVTAVPDAYYEVDYWLLDGRYAGSSNTVTVVMDAPHTLQPVFRRIQYSLSISATAGGTTSPPPGTYLYDAGTYASVSAIPDANYTFSHWVLDGEEAGSSSSISVFMDSSHWLTAVFQEAGGGENATGVALGTEMGKSVQGKLLRASLVVQAEPKLVIRDLKWTTWFDLFRGSVCQATGYLYDSNGKAIAYSDVVVEFLKRNFWTGETRVVSKIVRTNGRGYFAAEETCNPLFESFLGVQAWAEKPGYLPSWSLSAYLDPYSASVGKGSGFLAGVRVYLNGRYTAVPVTLSVEGVPPACSASFEPPSGDVDGLTLFQSVMALKVLETAATGNYTLTVEASSGKVSCTASFQLEVTEPVHVPSSVRFTAYGLDADARGVALVLDGSQSIYASQLPYTANWETNTRHSYSWTEVLGARVEGKRYVFEKAAVTTHYVSVATVRVEVARYDPQFTVLVYTMPKSPGNNSYEKHFAVIVRYDGNGPEKDLGKRAVFEGWDWYGHASRISAQQQLTGLTSIMGLAEMKPEDIARNLQTIMQLFNMTQGITFSATGIDAKTEGTLLKVDGESLTVEALPKTYSWPENTTHTYEWSVEMPVYKWVESPRWGTGHYEKVEDEWFSFEYALVMLPQLEIKGNVTLEEAQKLTEEFMAKLAKLPSPRGTINATKVGNRVTGVYSHNKLLKSIAEEAGVEYNALRFVNFQLPVFFSNESRYAKFIFDLDDKVAAEALNMCYNTSLCYRISFTSSAFTPQTHAFTVNFTCPLEYYQKAVDAKAFRWDPVVKNWTIDHTVRIEAFFTSAFNSTEEDWFRDYLKNQTVDETMFKMAAEDMYECHAQYFGGVGSASGVMNRTSAFYYNLNATAGRGRPYLGVYPPDRDALTEAIESAYAWWDSPSCKVSADSSRRTAGSSSVRVDADDVATACAVLHLIKPVDAFIGGQPADWGKLSFDIYLDEGCSGNVTVMLLLPSGAVSMSEIVEVGSWQTVMFPAAGRITAVGIYCELAEPSGRFWIDRLYFAKAWLWEWSGAVSLEKTVYVNFASDEPYTLYVNMDPASPLPVNVTSDDVKASRLTVDAAPQLGGLANVTVYAVTYAPLGYKPEDVPVGQLQLRKLFTVNLTAPEQWIEEMNFSGYRGYSAIRGGVLGFAGQTELLVVKDPEMKALPGYNATLLLIEAENVWGTKFHTVVAVQPWGKTFWEVAFEQIAMALIGIAIAAVIVGLVIKFLRESRGQL